MLNRHNQNKIKELQNYYIKISIITSKNNKTHQQIKMDDTNDNRLNKYQECFSQSAHVINEYQQQKQVHYLKQNYKHFQNLKQQTLLGLCTNQHQHPEFQSKLEVQSKAKTQNSQQDSQIQMIKLETHQYRNQGILPNQSLNNQQRKKNHIQSNTIQTGPLNYKPFRLSNQEKQLQDVIQDNGKLNMKTAHSNRLQNIHEIKFMKNQSILVSKINSVRRSKPDDSQSHSANPHNEYYDKFNFNMKKNVKAIKNGKGQNCQSLKSDLRQKHVINVKETQNHLAIQQNLNTLRKRDFNNNKVIQKNKTSNKEKIKQLKYQHKHWDGQQMKDKSQKRVQQITQKLYKPYKKKTKLIGKPRGDGVQVIIDGQESNMESFRPGYQKKQGVTPISKLQDKVIKKQGQVSHKDSRYTIDEQQEQLQQSARQQSPIGLKSEFPFKKNQTAQNDENNQALLYNREIRQLKAQDFKHQRQNQLNLYPHQHQKVNWHGQKLQLQKFQQQSIGNKSSTILQLYDENQDIKNILSCMNPTSNPEDTNKLISAKSQSILLLKQHQMDQLQTLFKIDSSKSLVNLKLKQPLLHSASAKAIREHMIQESKSRSNKFKQRFKKTKEGENDEITNKKNKKGYLI